MEYLVVYQDNYCFLWKLQFLHSKGRLTKWILKVHWKSEHTSSLKSRNLLIIIFPENQKMILCVGARPCVGGYKTLIRNLIYLLTRNNKVWQFHKCFDAPLLLQVKIKDRPHKTRKENTPHFSTLRNEELTLNLNHNSEGAWLCPQNFSDGNFSM